MTISSVSPNNSLLTRLEANGLSADKAKLVEKDMAAAQTASAVAVGSTPAITGSVRAALDTKIDADVSAGKLSAGDAAVVKKTLDDIEDQSGGSGISSQTAADATTSSPAGSASAGRSGGGGGGGGGGSSSKTELSETVTIAGSIKTTIITYTDDTTETTTTTATDADKAKYGKAPSPATGSDVVRSYLSTIEPGSLIDRTA